MFSQCAGLPISAVHFSRNWITEVWSETSEVTQPPRDHGEMSISGTRNPRPVGSGIGGMTLDVVSVEKSSGVPAGGTGGGPVETWPSFSSKSMITRVELNTPGSAFRAWR